MQSCRQLVRSISSLGFGVHASPQQRRLVKNRLEWPWPSGRISAHTSPCLSSSHIRSFRRWPPSRSFQPLRPGREGTQGQGAGGSSQLCATDGFWNATAQPLHRKQQRRLHQGRGCPSAAACQPRPQPCTHGSLLTRISPKLAGDSCRPGVLLSSFATARFRNASRPLPGGRPSATCRWLGPSRAARGGARLKYTLLPPLPSGRIAARTSPRSFSSSSTSASLCGPSQPLHPLRNRKPGSSVPMLELW